MAISDELLRAVLSMDAYNRGYDAGISGLGGVGAQLGDVTLIRQSDVDPGTAGVEASFYAAAYTRDGDVIISYRGTGYAHHT